MPRNKKRKPRKINPKAKRYSQLRKKQAIANKMVRKAKQHLGKSDHRAIKQAKAKIKQFYKKRGINRTTLSLDGLTRADLPYYEALLDSIINSTYLDESKYKEHKRKQLDFVIEQGFADTEEEAENVYTFLNSEIAQDVIELGVRPSEVELVYNDYAEQFGDDGLKDALQDFIFELSKEEAGFEELQGRELKVGDLFAYLDLWTKDYSKILRKQYE